MTQKKKPHYDITELKKLLNSKHMREITIAARRTATSLGYADDKDIVMKLLELKHENFFVSKTAHHDSSLWHDYYKLPQEGYALFIKLQLGHDGRCYVTSFKEDEENDY